MSPEEILVHALERYERPLISHAKLITGDLESARDAVQETFLRLSRQDIKALEPRLAPWLFFVCRNCALDHCRKIVRFSTDGLDEESPSEAPGPDSQAVAAEDKDRLRQWIERLPDQQREVLKLKFEADLSYKEIAEVLRMSVSHVGVQLHEAIQTLRTIWKKENAGVLP